MTDQSLTIRPVGHSRRADECPYCGQYNTPPPGMRGGAVHSRLVDAASRTQYAAVRCQYPGSTAVEGCGRTYYVFETVS